MERCEARAFLCNISKFVRDPEGRAYGTSRASLRSSTGRAHGTSRTFAKGDMIDALPGLITFSQSCKLILVEEGTAGISLIGRDLDSTGLLLLSLYSVSSVISSALSAFLAR